MSNNNNNSKNTNPPVSLVGTGTGALVAPRIFLYIDGFNFYYTSLKYHPEIKWVDFHKLMKLRFPNAEIAGIKYFTAKVSARPGDIDQPNRQNVYFTALKKHIPCFEIIYGHFLRHKIRMPNVNPPPRTLEVWKTEEKGSDVNLAVHMLQDAWLDKYDIAAVLSNDSDLAESFKFVKEQGKKVCFLKQGLAEKHSHKLTSSSSFIKEVRMGMLKKSQLPNPIPGTNIHKPQTWV
jgi:uncharacterized LabA/DUF88 family protein